MKFIRFGNFLMLCFWTMPLISMYEQIADQLEQEQSEQIIKKLGGKRVCDKILAQWSHYEKQLLVTILNEPQWPSHRIGAPVFFAKGKEVYKDRFTVSLENQLHIVALADFKILAELPQIPVFASYHAEMLKFAQFREHFETEDETWEQLDRQLNRGQ